MANYQKARVKLTNTQLNKLKPAAKSKTGTTFRITEKNFQDEELPRELLLATRQKTKRRNALTNNTSTYIKHSKAQISNIIQSGGFLGSWLGELGKKLVTDLAIPFAKNNLPGLVSNTASNEALNAINKFERRICFVHFEYLDDIIENVKSFEDSRVLIDGVTKAV